MLQEEILPGVTPYKLWVQVTSYPTTMLEVDIEEYLHKTLQTTPLYSMK